MEFSMDEKQLENIMQEVASLVEVAGSEVMKIYAEKAPAVSRKEDETPLTQADTTSNRILCDGLKHFSIADECPLPIISEENQQTDDDTRKSWRLFWMVDPLDGTKEFVSKNGEFTLNVALVRDKKPIMGVVYAPAAGVMYAGVGAKRAYRRREDADWEQLTGQQHDEGPPCVVASRSHLDEETSALIEALDREANGVERVSAGSSLKFCLVAEGKAQIYPRFAPTMEWDTAAAQAVVEGSGGKVISRENHMPLEYNKPNLENPHFLVMTPEGERLWQKTVE